MKPKTGRNDPCPCGSGQKYKRCCSDKDRAIAPAPLDDLSVGDAIPAHGDLAESESSLLVHLALYERLGNRAGMAAAFNNLGVVYQALGDLLPAQEMYQEALKLEEELDSPQGMVVVCDNLGQVYRAQGDLARAEAMHRQSARLARAGP